MKRALVGDGGKPFGSGMNFSSGRIGRSDGPRPTHPPQPFTAGGAERERPDSHLIAELVFPELADWAPVLDRLSLPLEERVRLAAMADANRRSLPEEVAASSGIGEARLHGALADVLGLHFVSRIDPRRLMLAEDDCLTLLKERRRGVPVKYETGQDASAVLLALSRFSPAEMKVQLNERPSLARRLRIVAPSVLRSAILARARPLLLRQAVLSLFERRSDWSARFVLNAWQGAGVGAGLVLLPLAFVLAPGQALMATHLAATLFFLACVLLRLQAIRAAPRYRLAPVPSEDAAELPVYSVLVALYRESEVVPELVEALSALDWPAGRLEVKLVCEEDDTNTIAAIRAAHPPAFFEIIAVPPAMPRTKPKALNYALPTTSGEFVALYDAEDRPDPLQLREAWARFRRDGADLACLQAPLVIANDRASALSRMFAMEYAALFRGLLPYLSARSAFLPLGGTSNHFRRAALDDAGAWDPFNVTEDADLGLRLARCSAQNRLAPARNFEWHRALIAIASEPRRWSAPRLQTWPWLG